MSTDWWGIFHVELCKWLYFHLCMLHWLDAWIMTIFILLECIFFFSEITFSAHM